MSEETQENTDQLDDKMMDAFFPNNSSSTQQDTSEKSEEQKQTSTSEEQKSEDNTSEKDGGDSQISTEQQTKEDKENSESTEEEEARGESSEADKDKQNQEVDYDAIIRDKTGGKFQTWAEFEDFKNQSEEATKKLQEIEKKPKNERILALEHFLESNPNASLSDFEKIDRLDATKLSKDEAVENFLQLKYGLTKEEAKNHIEEKYSKDEEGQFERVSDKIDFNEMYENAVKFISEKKEALYAPIRSEGGDNQKGQEQQSQVLTSESITKDITENVDSIEEDLGDLKHTYKLNDKQKEKVASTVAEILKESGVKVTADNISEVRNLAIEEASRLFKKEIFASAMHEYKANLQKEKDKVDHNPTALRNQDQTSETQETKKDKDDILFEGFAANM